MFGQDDNNDNSNTGTAPSVPLLPAEPTPDATLDNTNSSGPSSSPSFVHFNPTPATPSDDTSYNNAPTPATPSDDTSYNNAPTPATPSDDTSTTNAPTPATPSDDTSTTNAPTNSDLMDIKQKALEHLTPLVDHLDQTPEEKFRTTMMMIQASDDEKLIGSAFESAKEIKDDKERAQALLDVINEINYFSQAPENNAKN